MVKLYLQFKPVFYGYKIQKLQFKKTFFFFFFYRLADSDHCNTYSY